jgi:protein-disulfide isomerase
MISRVFAAAFAVFTLGLTSGSAGAAEAPAYREFVSGSPTAKVTMIEYASLTCPHCARFAEEVMPKVKKDYIDTGKIKFVYRDFPLDGLAAAGAQLARCAPGERGKTLIELMFKNQKAWVSAPKPIEPLRGYAQLAGMSGSDIDACLNNKTISAKINEVMQTASTKFKVESTPTFFVGEEKIKGELTYEALAKILDQHLAAAK